VPLKEQVWCHSKNRFGATQRTGFVPLKEQVWCHSKIRFGVKDQVWCYSKKHTRSYCNGTITRLQRIVLESIATVSRDTIGLFFMNCRAFEAAYREGHACATIDDAVKAYKSHRRVKTSESQ